MRNFRVLVNGNEYKVAIEELEETSGVITEVKQAAPVARPVKSTPSLSPKNPGKSNADSNGDTPGSIRAAMPGTILEVRVSVGEEVSRGQALLILEAMKMENEIMAPKDGVIDEIQVGKGASVNSGDLLIVMS